MRPNRLRAQIEAGEPVFGLFVFLRDPHVVGAAASVGFDFACVCQEHGQASHETLQEMVFAADAAGITAIARISDLSRPSILRALETGVQGVLMPWCQTAAMAEELVRLSRFAPLGQRGAYGNSYSSDYSRGGFVDYMATANREVLVMAQIESREGLAELDAIAAVEGLDVLMVGPGDLSVQLGCTYQWDNPELLAAIDRVVDVALAAGKQVGLLAAAPSLLDRYLARGVRLWWWGQDLNILRLGLLKDARLLSERYGWTPNPGRQPGTPPI
ncbi:MAG: hypothetical protein HYU66_04135 [Armatimonadetes bacterium]|nr:hypothetical protein [Armatimonadota bacterium]